MKNWINVFLSEDDQKSVANEVAKAELLTDAEIVPMIVKSSSPSGHVFPLLFFIFATLSLAVDFHYLFFPTLLVVLVWLPIAYWLSNLAWIKRLMTSNGDLRLNAQARAEIEFHRLNLQKTERRIGVLIFVSLDEHQAVVLADKTVSEKLPPETWDNVLKELLNGIKKSQAAIGFTNAIEMMGQILKGPFPSHRKNVNELSDRIVIKL